MSRFLIRIGVLVCLLTTAFFLIYHYHGDRFLETLRVGGASYKPRPGTEVSVGDKVVVMAKTRRENTDWVAEELPSWQRAIYSVDDATAPLHTPANKGHEAMAYLSYIIEHYDALPATMAFVHSHRGSYLSWWHSWHTDAAAFSNPAALHHLQLAFVQRNGYVNLRCAWKPGCVHPERANAHVTPLTWSMLFGNATPFPDRVAAACCAQFAVSRDRVRARRREEYVAYRDWLLNTELQDAKSGRVFEFSWHVIFGMDPV
ncbi:MAG: hypothetical protein M1838_005340 [Thelocarpon superellum]|nr:MAG: hypothetical protein M1838_005340 [Thelocarpon superellum]